MGDLRCPKCQNELSGPFAFCPECGHSLSQLSEPASAPTPFAPKAVAPGGPTDHSNSVPRFTADVAPPDSSSTTPFTSVGELCLRLEVRLPPRIKIHERISLQLRLTNLGPEAISALDLEVTSTLSAQSNPAFEFELGVGETAESSIQFTATDAGQHEVIFDIYAAGETRLQGRLPFSVNEPSQSTQVIHYQDARQIHGRVVVGTEGGRLEAAGIPLAEGFKTPDYVEVLLRRPARVRAIVAKRLHGIPLSANDRRVSLEIRVGSAVEHVGLLVGREFVLGRKRHGNDVVLRVTPPSAENEERTAKISRQHAKLRFEQEGLIWQNLKCSHGTTVNGTDVPKGEQFQVFQGARIAPAGELPLTCALFYEDQPQIGEEYARLARQIAVEPPEDAVGAVMAVRLSRHNSEAPDESYIFFQNRLVIGASPACPIQLGSPTVTMAHAHLLCFGGSFWLEPLQSVQPTLVNGEPISTDQLAQLRTHMHIQLGEVEIVVHPFRQCYVDFTP